MLRQWLPGGVATVLGGERVRLSGRVVLAAGVQLTLASQQPSARAAGEAPAAQQESRSRAYDWLVLAVQHREVASEVRGGSGRCGRMAGQRPPVRLCRSQRLAHPRTPACTAVRGPLTGPISGLPARRIPHPYLHLAAPRSCGTLADMEARDSVLSAGQQAALDTKKVSGAAPRGPGLWAACVVPVGAAVPPAAREPGASLRDSRRGGSARLCPGRPGDCGPASGRGAMKAGLSRAAVTRASRCDAVALLRPSLGRLLAHAASPPCL